jgi:hypothetical protein
MSAEAPPPTEWATKLSANKNKLDKYIARRKSSHEHLHSFFVRRCAVEVAVLFISDGSRTELVEAQKKFDKCKKISISRMHLWINLKQFAKHY